MNKLKQWGPYAALRNLALIIVGGLSWKLVDFKLFKFEFNWNDPVELRILVLLSIVFGLCATFWGLHIRNRLHLEIEQKNGLDKQISTMQAQLGDNVEKAALQLQIGQLQDELNLVKRRTYQFLEFEGLSLPSLIASMQESELLSINPVEIECWTMKLKLGADHSSNYDMNVLYQLKGKNTGEKNLIGLQFRISGDAPARKEELNLRCFDEIGKRALAVKTVQDKERTKILELEFAAPGVEPNHQFDLKFSFCWPRSFQAPKDYWYLDNINYKDPTRKIEIIIDSSPLVVRQASVYSISRNGNAIVPCGSALVDPLKPNEASFAKVQPEKDAFYLVLLELEMPIEKQSPVYAISAET